MQLSSLPFATSTACLDSKGYQKPLVSNDGIVSVLRMLDRVMMFPLQSSAEGKNQQTLIKEQLLTFVLSQGKAVNKKTGEEPGKFIYTEDDILGTPLCLVALYLYWEVTRDSEFLLQILPAVEQGLNWLITYGDQDKDFLLEYTPRNSVSHSSTLLYPLAPAAVQAVAWLALRLWVGFYLDNAIQYNRSNGFGRKLHIHAQKLKEQFNRLFIKKRKSTYCLFSALNAAKQPVNRSEESPLTAILWARYQTDRSLETIIENRFMKYLFPHAFEGR